MTANRIKIFASFSFFILICMILATTTVADAYADKLRAKSNKEFCDAINYKFKKFGWNRIICKHDRWEVFDYSPGGNPLLYQEFGFDNSDEDKPVNLVLCGVHGDEPSGIYQCFHLVREILFDNPYSLEDFKLVVAPIVNPDGFFLNTRQNGNGVDPNRNLPTKDWKAKAQKVWARYSKDPRKNPGKHPASEAETRIQSYLIDKYKPDKILSFHAPLGFLDFDGPGDRKYYNLVRVEQRARRVGLRLQANTNRFLKFVDFRFFPGSLGNYAGNERKIPTYTVELPTAHASNAHEYWAIIRSALIKALSYQVYDKETPDNKLKVKHKIY